MEQDFKILEILEDDALASPQDIATMLDSSRQEIEKRIKRLEKSGIIKKRKTIVDWKKAGRRRAQALIQVKVVPQAREGFDKTCKDIARDSRVDDVFVATGEYDLLVFVSADTLDEVSDFVTEKLAPKKDVVGTYTHVILSQFKRDGVVLDEDDGKRLRVSI